MATNIKKMTSEEFANYNTALPYEVIMVDKQFQMFNGETWEPIVVQETGEGISMSLYDLNKQILTQLPVLPSEAIDEGKRIIADLHELVWNDYYMLYGKEISYFTLFKFEEQIPPYNKLADEVIECLKEIGTIKNIEAQEQAVEIWVVPAETDEATCLYLFPYDQGIVYVGE